MAGILIGTARVQITPDMSGFITEIQAKIKSGLAAVRAEVPVKFDVDAASVAKAQAALGPLAAGKSVPLRFDVDPASVARARAALGPLAGKTIPVRYDVNPAGLVAADAATKALTADTNRSAAAAALATRRFGGLFRLAGARVPLFGGVFGTAGILGAVGAIHLLVDAVAEFLAVVIPASVALAAFGVGAAPTVEKIVQQMQRLQTVTDAYGTVLPGVTGGLDALARAVKPEVYSLFGEALTLVAAKTGEFTSLAVGAGGVLDKLAARFTLAITSSDTFSKILAAGVGDLAKIGDIVGNLGGVLGNVISVLPGYAGALLNLADAGSKVLEWASHVAEPVIGFGLAAHGAILYTGLLATGLVSLGRRATTTGTFLNRAGTAIGLIPGPAEKAYGSIRRLESGVFEAGVSSAEAGTRANIFRTALTALQKVPVWGWVAVGVAVLGGLAFALATAKDRTQTFIATLQANITGQKTFSGVTAATAAAITRVNSQLAQTPRQLAATGQAFGRFPAAVIAQHYGELRDGARQFNAEQATEHTRLAQLTRDFGSTGAALGIFNKIGIAASDIAKATASGWAQDVQAAKAYLTAVTALAGFQGGRALAAQKALQFSQDQQLAAITQITQAEDAFINRMIGGEQAFVTFLQDLRQAQKDAAGAGTSLSGLNKASLGLANDFYNKLIPAGQKQIDTLQAQFIPMRKLTVATATVAKTLIPLAHGNVAAKDAIVGLINNALGPGTVSLRTLNHWVGQNSTSLRGFKSIVDQSEVAASQLAKSLQNDLNVQFRQDLLASSGADSALKTYTADLVHNRAQTKQGKADRAQLIADLKAAGLSAKQAAAFVAGLARQVGGLHGKKITITEYGSGSFSISEAGHVVAHGVGRNIAPAGQRAGITGASGAFVAAGTTPTADDVFARVSKGELIVPAKMVTAGLVDHLRGQIPGFAAGGVIGTDLPVFTRKFDQAMTDSMTTAMIKAMTAAQKAAAAAAMSQAFGAAGPGGGAPAANAALARRMFPGEDFAAWNYVAMRESGWNQFARNPSSGAYGIPQALPFTKMPRAAWPASAGGSSNPAAQISWMAGYMDSVYGGAAGAAAHERAFNWYDGGIDGPWLPQGLSLAMNRSGGPEAVVRPDQLRRLEAGSGPQYHAHFDGLTGASIESHVRAALTAMSLNDGRRARIGRAQ